MFYTVATRVVPALCWQCERGCSSGVEHNLAKVGVEGSNPFTRSSLSRQRPAKKSSQASCLTDSRQRLCLYAARQSSSRNLHRSHYGHSEDDMATIRKRNGRWQAQIRKSGTRAISRTFTLRQDALFGHESRSVFLSCKLMFSRKRRS